MAAPPPCCQGTKELLVDFDETKRTKITRGKKRGTHERQKILDILAAAKVCTVSYLHNGEELRVVPQLFGVHEGWLYLHGSVSSTMFKNHRQDKQAEGQSTDAEAGAVVKTKMAISATLIDGLVLARAHMHNSVNYRSVVIFADTVHVITDKEEKDKGLRIITEHVLKGRWDDPDARNPNKAERDSTAVVKIKLSECSAKIRTGGPNDDKDDMKNACWAGDVPLYRVYGCPNADKTTKGRRISVPRYLRSAIEDSRGASGMAVKPSDEGVLTKLGNVGGGRQQLVSFLMGAVLAACVALILA
mmetsp:Transcript_4130/g.5077  ORF Transcript_4130/g.5077 Transcript_4130/m.5077 type:complete len:302 (-) Transcript_4130:220-1125(-)